jgi:ribose 1,5-bisphosphokinase
MTGALVAVVGPSGAGKDAVIEGARRRFAADPRVVFPQRVITRPAGPGEDHRPVSASEFADAERAGGFAIRWDAHGLRYGVPVAVAGAVREGAIAVVNVSRAVLADLPAAFGEVHVVRVSVPEEVRRERILARGRESSADALGRLERPDPAPDARVDLEIANDGPLDRSVEELARFVAGLIR